MDFLDPNKKRAHKTKLYIGYALMAIAISLGAVVLLYVAYGYGVDRNGNVFQNGLVFVASNPDAAEVKIDSQDGKLSKIAVTSDRLFLPANSYTFQFLKRGYRPWQHTVDLRGGDVQRLTYPFLFPDELKSSDIDVLAQKPGLVSSNPDRSLIVAQHSPTSLDFSLYDASKLSDIPSTFSLASSLLSSAKKSQKLELIEWSKDDRNLLVKHIFDDEVEFIIIDTQDVRSSININSHLDLEASKVQLRDQNSDEVYIQKSSGELVSADLNSKDITRLVSKVLDFDSFGSDMILYLSTIKNSKTGDVNVSILTNNEKYKVRELPKSSEYLIDIAKYNDSWLVAAGSVSDDRIYVYRNPVTFLKANNPNATPSIRTMRIDNPEHISFSAKYQFIAVQSNQSFDVYDALNDKQNHFSVKTKFDKNSGQATWMDSHRLLAITGGKVTVFDFDGTNYQLLSNILAGTAPMFDPDYDNLISVAPSTTTKNKQALIVTSLKVE